MHGTRFYVRAVDIFYFAFPDYFTVTSSVTYCDPPETLLVQQFDIVYYNKNESIFFNISASSVVSMRVFRVTSILPSL